MTDRVLVNRTRNALLPDNSPEKGYRITREEAAELGLVDAADKPVQQRRVSNGPLRTVEKVGPTAQKRRTARKKG